MLLVRIRPEEDEAVLLGDEAPARAARRTAGVCVGLPDGVQESPVDEPPPEQDHQDEKEGVEKPGHRRRALNQFMNAEIARLIVRYTAMMTAMPSIACPVWLIAVLAMETSSG